VTSASCPRTRQRFDYSVNREWSWFYRNLEHAFQDWTEDILQKQVLTMSSRVSQAMKDLNKEDKYWHILLPWGAKGSYDRPRQRTIVKWTLYQNFIPYTLTFLQSKWNCFLTSLWVKLEIVTINIPERQLKCIIKISLFNQRNVLVIMWKQLQKIFL